MAGLPICYTYLMAEYAPKPVAEEVEAVASPEKSPKERYVELARELFERAERFPFPGIEESVYAKLKEEEAEYPDYTTPIDELILRFQQEGLKITFIEHKASVTAYVLPVSSDDTGRDSLRPRQLLMSSVTDARLKELVELNRALKAAS